MKNLIFISHRMPWPLNKGEKIRAWNVIQHLAPNYNVHLGCVVDDPADMAHIARLQSVCASVGAFPIDKKKQKYRALLHARPGRPLMPDFYYAPALQQWIDETMARTPMDILYIYSVAMAPYVIDLKRPGKILDAQDIDSEKWAEYATKSAYPMKAVWAREARTLLAYERRAAAACDFTFFVTANETKRFAELAPEVGSRSVAVNVASISSVSRLRQSMTLRSMARPRTSSLPAVNMDYWPNADAVRMLMLFWFAQEIMPLLLRRVPGAQFWAVGANPGADVRALASLPGVHVTGRVEDVRPYVAHASGIVCPLRIARGIQNKVLEGMAMGKPVIASPPAFEGVRAQAGRDLLVADGPVAFVDTICDVLDGKHAGLGVAARNAMARNYAWENVLSAMDPLLDSAMARPTLD